MAALTDVAVVLVVSGLFVLFGVVSMRQAFRRRKQRNLIRETPTEEVRSVSLGQSELKGTAGPAEEGTIPAPFTDEECLVAQWEIEEYDVTTDSDGDEKGRWRTVESGVDHVPFVLDDGTGELLVRPDDAIYEIDEGADGRIEVPVGTAPPAPVREFESRAGIDEPTAGEKHGENREGDRRYEQHLLQPGEDTYAFGVVQRREDVHSAANEENLVLQRVTAGDEDLEDMFMIGDRSEEEIVADRKYAILYFPVGALLTTIGLGVLIVGGLGLLGIEVG